MICIVFRNCVNILSSLVKIRLPTENQLPRLPGSAIKVWLVVVVWVVQLITLSLPTWVEVELGCDNWRYLETWYDLLVLTLCQRLIKNWKILFESTFRASSAPHNFSMKPRFIESLILVSCWFIKLAESNIGHNQVKKVKHRAISSR